MLSRGLGQGQSAVEVAGCMILFQELIIITLPRQGGLRTDYSTCPFHPISSLMLQGVRAVLHPLLKAGLEL